MCWSNHRADRGSWPRQIDRPEPVDHSDLRVSDGERDEVVEQLSRHTGDGRLTLEEFEERVEEALHARTRRDLDATLRGLPRAPQRVTRRRRDLRASYRAAVIVAVIVLAVATAGPWVLFFVVPMAMCSFRGGHGNEWRAIEEPRSDRDELTLV